MSRAEFCKAKSSTSALRFNELCILCMHAFLFNTVAQSAYLSYCSLSVSLIQSGHSPLSSSHQHRFSTNWIDSSWKIFILLFCAFCVYSMDCCPLKSQDSSSFWRNQSIPFGTIKKATVKALEAVVTCMYIYALCCWLNEQEFRCAC